MMQYLDKESVWLLSPRAGEDYEILVPGNSSEPTAFLLQFAERVLPVLPSLVTRALTHIEEFTPRASPSEGDEWHFEGVDFGYQEALGNGRFRLCFSNAGDIYAEWSVVFQESEFRYFPVRLCRAVI